MTLRDVVQRGDLRIRYSHFRTIVRSSARFGQPTFSQLSVPRRIGFVGVGFRRLPLSLPIVVAGGNGLSELLSSSVVERAELSIGRCMQTMGALCCARVLMCQPIVFVGGVHGSGKTTICRLIAEAYPAVHVTAGALIREAADASHVVTVGAQDKAVPDVDANQAMLLRGLEAYRARTGDVGLLLLDGHFALADAGGTPVDVPLAVFRKIGPGAVLLVETDPAMVHRRLAGRGGRCSLAGDDRQNECPRTGARNDHGGCTGRPYVGVGGDGPAEEAAHAALAYMRSFLRSEA